MSHGKKPNGLAMVQAALVALARPDRRLWNGLECLLREILCFCVVRDPLPIAPMSAQYQEIVSTNEVTPPLAR